MLQWIIIGGGIHGTLVANFLVSSRKFSPCQIKIVDPHPHLLFRWKHCTRNCGMDFMRSTSVHHIDVPPFALEKYSRKTAFRKKFIEPYSRPSLELFNDHCQAVIDKNKLSKLYKQAQVNNIHIKPQYLEVETSAGSLKTKRVLLAIGAGSLSSPDWSEKVRAQHIFSTDFDREKLKNCKNIAVIGSGISAAQTAVAMSKQCPKANVFLIANHKPHIQRFDSDPGWISGYIRKFHKIKDYTTRREVITNARYRGTMTKEVSMILTHAMESKRVQMIVDKIKDVCTTESGYSLQFCQEHQIECDQIIFATGFSKKPPGKWLQNTISQNNLPQAPCGYPIVDSNLHWANNIYVTGALAELEVGPVSRNIAGARISADRIVKGVNH